MSDEQEISIGDATALKTIEFIETIKEEFKDKTIVALNIKRHGIQQDNELLLFWLSKNKNDYELIDNDIRRTTKEERIKNILKLISQYSDEIINNTKLRISLSRRNDYLGLKKTELNKKYKQLTNGSAKNET